MWLFHAAVDDQVGVNGSRRMLQALLSARHAPPVLVRVSASGGRTTIGGGATDAPAVRVPAARVLRSGDGEVRYTKYGYTYYRCTMAIYTYYYGEVRYTEYLGADGNAHTASIWWALSDPALGAWAFGGVDGGGGGSGGSGGGAPPPPATAAAAATRTAELQLSRRRRRRAAAAELQLELRQLTRVARRVDYSDPTVSGWRGDGLPVLTSERAPSRERNSRRVKRGLARVRDAHASCPLEPLQWLS